MSKKGDRIIGFVRPEKVEGPQNPLYEDLDCSQASKLAKEMLGGEILQTRDEASLVAHLQGCDECADSFLGQLEELGFTL